jgi:MFS family permease
LISFSRYADLFRVPDLRATLIASIVGRLPIGIATLAILLFLQARSGSFTLAGAAAASYVLGLAAIAPLLGRMMDRMGPRPVLSASAVVYPFALLLLIVLVVQSARPWWIFAAAAVAGAAFPPVTICMRALYPRLVPDPGLLQTAYSVDSALVETMFILGPALVAGLVAFGAPIVAVGFAAACAAMGAAVFLRSPGVRGWRRFPPARRSLLGPLRNPQLLAVFAANALYAVAFGLYEMAVIAHAAHHGRPAAAGIVLALASAGSAIGVLFYGGREWRAPVPRQFLVAVGCLAGGMLLLAPIEPLLLFALANLIAGLPMAPVIAVQSLLVSRLTPREMLAESFTWGTTCLLGGISLGIAAGGVLAEIWSPAAILVAAAGAAVSAGVIVWATVKDGIARAAGRGS